MLPRLRSDGRHPRRLLSTEIENDKGAWAGEYIPWHGDGHQTGKDRVAVA